MEEKSESLVWLISGASRGIGRAIAREALSRGHRVAAGVRKLEDAEELLTQYSETCLPVLLDMTDESLIRESYGKAVQQWGWVDVLVNNAGYGVWGMMEELSMEQIRQQMEVNFFGLVTLTRCAVPDMRKRKSGLIVNVSSLAGLRGMQGLSAYNASKFAVEGFTEALAQEMSSFQVRVCLVEPGPYRTDWAGNSLDKTIGILKPQTDSPYYELNQVAARRISMSDGKQPGNPEQIAQVLMEAALSPEVPLHMLFGDVCIEGWEQRKNRFDSPDFIKYYPHHKTTLI